MACRRAQLVYKDVDTAFTDKSKSLLINVPNLQKWRSTVKTAVFGSSSGLSPLVTREKS